MDKSGPSGSLYTSLAILGPPNRSEASEILITMADAADGDENSSNIVKRGLDSVSPKACSCSPTRDNLPRQTEDQHSKVLPKIPSYCDDDDDDWAEDLRGHPCAPLSQEEVR